MNALLKLTRNYRYRNLYTLVRRLIERGIDVNATSPDSFNALHNVCAYYEHDNLPDLILLLKASLVDLEAETKEGHTALSLAVSEMQSNINWKFDRVVEILLSNDEEFQKLMQASFSTALLFISQN